MRNHRWTLWVVALGCVLHPLEEYFSGWQAWAVRAFGINMPTSVFVVMNGVLVVAAVVLARGGWRNPAAALVIPAATLTNAIVFHIVPALQERRLVPGIFTAVLLYLPFGLMALIGARSDGVPKSSVQLGLVAGIAMALGVVLVAMLLTP